MTEPVEAGSHLRPAFVLIGGRTVAEHQLDIALDFGCDRIVCLVRALEPQVLALQHRAERAGKPFQTVPAARDLSALVTANDEVVLLVEGLLADHERALDLLESGSGVFTQPVDGGVAAGFERLDINHASAGMMRIPGRLIENLVQLPSDCDVSSALTHLALQHGSSMREIPAEARSGLQWQMIRNENDAFAIEHDWLAQQIGHSPPHSPGQWLARQGVFGFGPSLLHAGNASFIMFAAMAAVMVLALGIGWLGSPAGGFLCCALAWVLYRAAILLRRIERPRVRDGERHAGFVPAMGWLLDGSLAVLAVWSEPSVPDHHMAHRIFVPVIFLLLIRLLLQMRNMPGRQWFGDRLVLSALLAFCAVLGALDWSVAVGTVALVVTAIAVTRPDGD